MLILVAEDEHSGVFDGVAAWPVDCAENRAPSHRPTRGVPIHAVLLWPAATESTSGPRTSTVTAIPRGYARLRCRGTCACSQGRAPGHTPQYSAVSSIPAPGVG